MRRFAFLCGGLASLMMVQSAIAQPVLTTNGGLAIWYDVRSNAADIANGVTAPAAPFTTGQSLIALNNKKKKAFAFDISAGNFGGPGDGDVLRISPRLPLNPNGNGEGLHVTGKKAKNRVDQSIKNIYAYATVEPNGVGTDQVIGALGQKLVIRQQSTGPYHGSFAPGAGAANLIENVSVTPVTTEWDGQSGSAMPDPDTVGNPNGWIVDTKQVQVPVTDLGAGPVYDVAVGAVPSAAYKVACIQITAGVWANGAKPQNSTFEGFDEVNNLLMNRVVSSGGPAPAEAPDFGYLAVDLGNNIPDPVTQFNEFATGSNGGIPEANSGGDGNTVGTTSIEADFTIIIQMKGDFNNSGTVTTGDIVPMQNSVTNSATLRQRQIWLGDANGSGTVTTGDIVPFQNMLSGTGNIDCVANPALCAATGTSGGPLCP